METNEEITYATEQQPTNPGDNASVNGSAGGWSGRWDDYASTATGNGPEQFRRASRSISDSLANIAAGRSDGQYPALDTILAKHAAARSGRCTDPTHDCQRIRSGEQSPHESAAHPPRVRLIDDVFPVLRERVAITEHEVANIKDEIKEVKREAIHSLPRLASKDEVEILERAVENRINNDILPAIASVRANESTKDLFLTVSTIVSLAANAILLYKQFIK